MEPDGVPYASHVQAYAPFVIPHMSELSKSHSRRVGRGTVGTGEGTADTVGEAVGIGTGTGEGGADTDGAVVVGAAVGGPGHTTLEQSVVVVHVAGVVTWPVSVHSHVPLNESSNASP